MEQVTLVLTIPQVNVVLAALGDRPYKEVFEVGNLVQSECMKQLGPKPPEAPKED